MHMSPMPKVKHAYTLPCRKTLKEENRDLGTHERRILKWILKQ